MGERHVADRIKRYRAAATDLREAIAACVTDEDHLLLARDIEAVRTRLPIVSALYFGPRGIGRSVVRRLRSRPFQQFLYREFIRAWKLSGS